MTRKRYIKHLMAVGVSRNTAVYAAEAARATGKSYDFVFQDQMRWIYEQLIAEVSDFISGLQIVEGRVDG